MYLEIISPEKTLFEGEIDSVVLPGSDGSFGVLYNHAPLISTLSEGTVKYKLKKEQKEEEIEISGGTAEVLHNNIIVLAK